MQVDITKEDVLKFLPHRDPFLFIDSIERITDAQGNIIAKGELKDVLGVKVCANYYVREDLDIFRGHFPTNPVLPGVIQVEMMAQSCCFSLIKMFKSLDNLKLEVALAKVDNAKFRRPVKPAMHLKIVSECVKVRGNTICNHAKILYNDEVMSEADFMATHNVNIK